MRALTPFEESVLRFGAVRSRVDGAVHEAFLMPRPLKENGSPGSMSVLVIQLGKNGAEYVTTVERDGGHWFLALTEHRCDHQWSQDVLNRLSRQRMEWVA